MKESRRAVMVMGWSFGWSLGLAAMQALGCSLSPGAGPAGGDQVGAGVRGQDAVVTAGDPPAGEGGSTSGEGIGGTGGATGSGGSAGGGGWGAGGNTPADAGGVAAPADAGNDEVPLAPPGPWAATAAGSAPPIGAFPAGQEGTTTFYACRAPFKGGVQGGKGFPTGNCNFGYGGAEVVEPSYEVLVGALFTWQPTVGPILRAPPHAVPSGREVSGILQYVCRASYMTGIHPGKMVKGACSIGYGGSEVGLSSFDLLLDPGAPVDNLRDRGTWKATASSTSANTAPENALDDDNATRWSSGHAQVGGEWFGVDMGAPATIQRVILDAGNVPGDFPTKFDLATSLDGAAFTSVATGPGAQVLNVTFAPTSARYVKITQTGQSNQGKWWAIGDLAISDQ